MKTLTILVFLSVYLTFTATAGTETEFEFDEKIIQLTDEIFEKQLAQNDKENKVILAMFYAPWCGHCKRLKTTWNEMATEIEKNDYTNVTLAVVNCDKESETSKRMRVNSFPTVVAFHQGQNYKFKGRRTQEILINFAFYEFKNVESKPLSNPPSTLEIIFEVFHEIIEVFMELIKAHPYITITIVVVFVSVFGFLIKLIITDIREANEYDRQMKERKKKVDEMKKQEEKKKKEK
eukprot:TRINITY_DN1413_c0_g2_i3.p1 TRINITY_DN1413_c0_g2~~TRINITY_DN1413_c0_g2_i3.p1  ORF type:complete len:235 (-),score=45.97 TRINITY_DN1413_c0_g2_i3:68-772(-)